MVTPVLRSPVAIHARRGISQQLVGSGVIGWTMKVLLGQLPMSESSQSRGGPLGKYRGSHRRTDKSVPEPNLARTPALIDVIGRPTTETLLIHWSDSRSGHYAEQLWRLGRSRINSVCVLSGAPIAAGDKVFRPLCHGSCTPANRDFMISPDAISAQR